MAFASHGVSVSPEAGLSNGGVVVVATTVVVVAMTGAGVVAATFGSVELHALTTRRAQHAEMSRFTR